jgi:hypothetical protein
MIPLLAMLAVPLNIGIVDTSHAQQQLPKVALFGSETGTRLTNIVNNITAEAAGILDVANRTGCALATPTLVDLQQYEAVFVWSDCQFANGAALGNVLADYVDGGGRVVLASHVWWPFSSNGIVSLDIRGRFASGGYNPIANGTIGIGGPIWSPVIVDNTTNIFNGVNNVTFTGIDNATSITAGSTLVAHTNLSTPHPLVAYKGNVVALNFFPASTAVQGGSWTGDGARLIVNALQFEVTPSNLAPTAAAGEDQAIRAGDIVNLDGSASFDDNTATIDLDYAWSFSSLPAGSLATLSGDTTATPSFTADLPGTYVVELVVTDEGALPSAADQVEISSDNLAPTAAAGDDQLVIIGANGALDGSGSSDPESDPLTFDWAITSAPAGSLAVVDDPFAETTFMAPDLEGTYEVTLTVSDFLGEGAPDLVEITAITPEGFAETQILAANAIIDALLPGQVTTKGNKKALQNFLNQAVKALLEGDIAEAVSKLEQAIGRTDGCALRGSPDGNGPGRDWITDCDSQTDVYALLNDALDALLAL